MLHLCSATSQHQRARPARTGVALAPLSSTSTHSDSMPPEVDVAASSTTGQCFWSASMTDSSRAGWLCSSELRKHHSPSDGRWPPSGSALVSWGREVPCRGARCDVRRHGMRAANAERGTAQNARVGRRHEADGRHARGGRRGRRPGRSPLRAPTKAGLAFYFSVQLYVCAATYQVPRECAADLRGVLNRPPTPPPTGTHIIHSVKILDFQGAPSGASLREGGPRTDVGCAFREPCRPHTPGTVRYRRCSCARRRA